MGMAWAAVGFAEWQQHLVLPGYEDRVLLLPKGSKPYLMSNDNKRPKNSMVAVTNPMPLVVQIVKTRDKGGITKTRGTTVTREVVTMAIMEGVEVSRGEDTTLMQTKTRVVDPVAGEINTTPPTGK